MILGIDTSLGTAVAVTDADGAVRAEAASTDPLGHAEIIGTLLQNALTDAARGPIGATGAPQPVALTAVAAGMGPGPFTGLRVGIAAARAFALGRGIPVIPVVSHDAAALAVFLAGGHVRLAVALPMAACNLAGGLVGARLAIRRGNGFVRVLFLLVVGLLVARLAWDQFAS